MSCVSIASDLRPTGAVSPVWVILLSLEQVLVRPDPLEFSGTIYIQLSAFAPKGRQKGLKLKRPDILPLLSPFQKLKISS